MQEFNEVESEKEILSAFRNLLDQYRILLREIRAVLKYQVPVDADHLLPYLNEKSGRVEIDMPVFCSFNDMLKVNQRSNSDITQNLLDTFSRGCVFSGTLLEFLEGKLKEKEQCVKCLNEQTRKKMESVNFVSRLKKESALQ